MLPCFRTSGGILKGRALAALALFTQNALAILEYLGNYESDLNVILPGASGKKGAGSAAAFFVLGPFCVVATKRLRHGHSGFSSIFLSEDDSAAGRALEIQ
jgi:hypothetical protein